MDRHTYVPMGKRLIGLALGLLVMLLAGHVFMTLAGDYEMFEVGLVLYGGVCLALVFTYVHLGFYKPPPDKGFWPNFRFWRKS